MLPQKIREQLVADSGVESLNPHARKMLTLFDRLNSVGFLDDLEVWLSLLNLCIKVPSREGRVEISYDSNRDEFEIAGYHWPEFAPVAKAYIKNTESPIQEIETFIERVKPDLGVSWKSNTPTL